MAEPTITVRLPAGLIAHLDDIARQDEVSRSLVVRRMLLSGVARRSVTSTETGLHS